MSSGLSRDELVRRGETMNGLKDRQRTLNMRLLLAIQNHDGQTQLELERQLHDIAEQISCFSSRTRFSP